MAISSTSSSGSASGSGSMIDVAGIVSQLMAVEQKPIAQIDRSLQTSSLKISALASFQSKLSSFKDALDALQNPANFNVRAVTSSLSSVATVNVTNGQTPDVGRINLTVTQTATSSLVNIAGFTSNSQALSNATSYSIQVGSTTYAPTAADNITTPTQLRDWINNKAELKDSVRATLVQQDSSRWVLSLQGLSTGSAHQVSVTGPSGGTTSINMVQSAQDAQFTLNGIQFTRDSNTITDAVNGLTLKLVSASATPTVIDIAEDTSAVAKQIQTFVTRYNELLSEFKQDTQSSLDASQRGALNSDLTLSTIMRQINAGLMKQIKSASGANLGNASDLSMLGVEFNSDGTLNFNQKLFDASAQLPRVMAQGVSLGYTSPTQTLSSTLSNILGSSGSLADRIDEEKMTQSNLNKRKTNLQEKLATMQERYTAQYASLDALLFKLNNTNNALKSALDGLTNSQKSN
jgi:flagellar hook-associated protein 2